MSLNLDLIKDINTKVNDICDTRRCDKCPAHNITDCNKLLVRVKNFATSWQLGFNANALNKGDFWNVQALIEYVEKGLQCNGDCENCDNITLCKDIDNFAVVAYLHLQNIFNALDKA